MSSRRSLLSTLSVAAVALAIAACPAPVVEKKKQPPPPPGRTTFGFEPIDVSGSQPRWGNASTGDFVVGGVDGGAADIVTTDLLAVDASDGTVRMTPKTSLAVARMCNCALFDPGRNEMVVFGGRDTNFADNDNAEIVNVVTGDRAQITGATIDHPIGCQAFFSSKADKGYVFGGLSSTQGNFTDKTYRYDPSAHTLTALDITGGPGGRYDADIHQLNDGNILMVSGMGATAFAEKFYQDMWEFDTTAETWSEIATTSTTLPPGRRYAWASLAPDESMMLYGFGSDSGTGQHVLGDLWSFTFETGAWAKQDVDGDLPSARGFTYNIRGPADTAGVLAFGTDSATNVLTDAFQMKVPAALVGNWH